MYYEDTTAGYIESYIRLEATRWPLAVTTAQCGYGTLGTAAGLIGAKRAGFVEKDGIIGTGGQDSP